MRTYILVFSAFLLSHSSYAKRKDYKDVTNTAVFSRKLCQLSAHCEKNKNPYWAKFQYSADLAEEEIQSLLKSYSLDRPSLYFSNTAVLDSGFDGRSQINNLNIVPRLYKGHEDAGNEKIDPVGHGTAVAGMIAGTGVGFTKYVNLNVYRITRKHGGGSVSSKNLSNSIKKACDTSEIVNVSWGSSADEMGMKNPKEEKWFDYAAKKGCLIVKSSGNGGIKRYNSYNLPIDAPIILVSSTNSLGIESSFSSQGHIYGPGENVFTLNSHQSKVDQWRFENYCKVEGAIMAPISGTSFSSPAVAAVFSQVLTVLKIRNLVPKNPLEKITLLKKIILASGKWSQQTGESLPTANAFLAVLIAKNLDIDEVDLSIDELIEVGKRESSNICLGGDTLCSEIITCSKKKECLKVNRKKMYLCENQRKDITIDLISSFGQMKEAEMLSYMGSRLNSNDFDSTTINEILNKSWTENLDDKGRIDDSDIAFDLFERAIKLGQEEFISTQKFSDLINDSYYISGIDSLGDSGFDLLFHREKSKEELKREKEAGVVSFEKIRKKKIFNMFNNLEESKQLEILSKVPTKQYKFSEEYTKVQSGFLSLLVENKERLNHEIKNIVTQKVKDLGKSLSNELDQDKRYVTKLNESKIKIFLEADPNFLNLIKNKIKKPFFKNSSSMVNFVLNYSNILLGMDKFELSKLMLSEIDSKISFLESINSKSKSETIEKANRLYVSINKVLPQVLSNIIESKKYDESIIPLIKRVMLAKVPLAKRSNIINFSYFLSSPFQKAFYNDTEFLKKYILQIFDDVNKVYSLKGVVWEDSWENVSRSFRNMMNGLLFRVQFKKNFDTSFMVSPMIKTLDILSKVYDNEKKSKSISNFQVGFISKYILNRGEKYKSLVKRKKYSSTLAIYAGTEIAQILGFFRKLNIDKNNDLFSVAMSRLKKEYDADNDRLDIGRIREEIARHFGIGEFY